MVLLDAVAGWDDRALSAVLEIRADTPFREDAGVPAHVGIEYMAQACGAFAGIESLEAGRPVRIGFLLGTRRFVARDAWFRVGDRLVVDVTVVFREGRMGVFDCRITRDGQAVASARLTVFMPDDVTAFLDGHAGEGTDA